MANNGDTPSDLLRKRANQSKFKLWVLLEAGRWLITSVLLIIFFTVILGLGYLYPAAETAIRTGDSVDTLFQGFLTAIITGVTLILTLNQLVLSQELGAVKDQRGRMEGSMEFRKDVADIIEAPVSPSRPAQFLRALIEVSGSHAKKIRNSVIDIDDEQLTSDINDFTESLIENSKRVSRGLDNARFGDFDVISSALNFNYSWKIFTAKRIKKQYNGILEKEDTETLEDLVETLKLFGPAREHFKTLYFQWDLINLSRSILVASIPALLASTSMIIFFNSTTYSLVIFEVQTIVLVITIAATISILPFIILLAYVLRIATITKHTLSIGPFILRETEDIKEVEWGS